MALPALAAETPWATFLLPETPSLWIQDLVGGAGSRGKSQLVKEKG